MIILIFFFFSPTSITPSQSLQLFVKSDPPLARSQNLWVYRPFEFTKLWIKGVELSQLSSIKPTYFDFMRNLTTEDIDMQRIQDILEFRMYLQKSRLERDTSHFVTHSVMLSFFRDPNMDTLSSTLMKGEYLQRLQAENTSFWQKIMKPFALEKGLVTIITKPSKAKMAENEAEEKKFIKDRMKALGEQGLKEKARILEEAQAKNSAQMIPGNLLETIPAPRIDSIYLPEEIRIWSRRFQPDVANQNTTDMLGLIDVRNLPYSLQMNQYDSELVTLTAYVRMDELDQELKPLLPVYLLMPDHDYVPR